MHTYRDTGPYSARNSSKGALVVEAGRLIEGLREGVAVPELHARALDGGLFSQQARTTRYRIWEALHLRCLSGQPGWVLADLQTARGHGPHSREVISILYLHYALSDRLTFDLITQVLWERWCSSSRAVTPGDAIFLLDQAADTQPQIRRWSEKTRLKLASSTMTALRDFGLLAGSQKKILVQPPLPLGTADHLLHILTAEGVRGADVLRDPTWRLFLLDEDDVAHLLSQLAQGQRIGFERVGSTVVLHTPDEWSEVP